MKVIEKIISDNKSNNTLFVFKGFSVTEFGVDKVFIQDIIDNPVQRLQNLASDPPQIISFDEFIFMYEFLVKQYKKIVIIENPEYINLFPVDVIISEEISEKLLAHFDDEMNGDTNIEGIEDYLNIYNNYIMTNNGIACCYNISSVMLKSNKFERKVIELSECLELNTGDEIDKPDNHCVICDEKDYFCLVSILKNTNEKVFVSYNGCSIEKSIIIDALKYLNGLYKGRINLVPLTNNSVKPTTSYPRAKEIMKDYWGYSSYRDIKTYDISELENNKKVVVSISQEKIISDLIEQVERCVEGKSFKDMFVTASTGAGKSLMFLIPAIYIAEKYNLVTLVITPLIGLMNDQVQALERRGYHKARTINSDISPVLKQTILDEVANGDCHILYLSPESLMSRSDIETLIGKRKIGMVIVDESHIVTTWGKQFRPDYWYLGDHVQKIRKKQCTMDENPMSFIIATFTATAIYEGNEDMYHETLNSLHMIDPITYLGYIKRDNIEINVNQLPTIRNRSEYELDKFNSLIGQINKAIIRNQKVLIYFPTVALINRFVDYCYAKNLSDYVTKFHGQLSPDVKESNRKDFLRGTKLVMAATKAFGMGIDIPDITIVAHFAPTGNVCDYMQEIGRAARDISIQGKAVYQHMNNDFKHINRFHGLSAIKKYQLIKVIEKILEIYLSSRYSNNSTGITTRRSNEMLIDTDNFEYIFNDPMSDDDNNLMNKVKTAMLLIQKDYENRGFAPFYMRPIPLFAFGYFSITDHTKRLLNAKYNNCAVLKNSTLNVYEINLKKIWEFSYRNDMSFMKFKFLLYSKDKSFDFNTKYTLKPAMSVEVYFNNYYQSVYNNIIKTLKNIFNQSAIQSIYFSDSELIDMIKNNAKINNYKAETILNVTIAAISTFCKDYSNRMIAKCYSTRVAQNRKVSYKFETSIREFFNWIERGFDRIKNEVINNHMYIINTGAGNSIKEVMTCLGVLEAFGVLKFKSLGGSNSQIYVYVNETKRMTMVKEKPYLYENKLLETINNRHNESVKMLTFLFQNNFSSAEIWEHLENYFLGILRSNLIVQNNSISINSGKIKSVKLQIGDSLSDDYSCWVDANVLFDNNTIEEFDNFTIRLADYYNAKLLIDDYKIEAYLVWEKEKIMITSGEEDQVLREIAADYGWKCIPIDKLSLQEFIENFKGE